MTAGVIAILLVSSALAALGQVLLKLGATQAGGLTQYLNLYIFGGVLAYAIGLVLWLMGLARAPLHVVSPFTMFTFVRIGLASVVLFGERPTAFTMAGWGIICLGVTLVYAGS